MDVVLIIVPIVRCKMNKFQGSINKIIFKSDNNYMVLLFKVLKNDLDNKYNNKTITITGYFYDISEELNL